MGRWRRMGIAVALYLAAVALGLGSAWWVLRSAPASLHQVSVGAWVTSTLAGSPEADAYTRARVALEGLLALGRFSLSTGPAPQPGLHWLPTPGNRGVVLTLRLYHPSAGLQAAPAKLVAPAIRPYGPCPR